MYALYSMQSIKNDDIYQTNMKAGLGISIVDYGRKSGNKELGIDNKRHTHYPIKRWH